MSLGQNAVADNQGDGAWITLFDGSSTDEWRLYNEAHFPAEGWVIEDNALVLRPRADGRATGDIMSKRIFRDFELQLEWMVEEGGNSGIFYHILEQPSKAIYWSGLEMQVLDDENHPDSFQGVNGNRQAGSLYDLLPIEPKTARPFGQWNEVRIISQGPTVEHWLNGERVLHYERWTVEWFAMLRDSKFREHNEFGAMQQGHIGLQDHGDVVRFRNIRIREL
ncbi:MAG: glycosyl hydrolase [Gammaproteobacteria bacterium]|nr:glycosyl hydrolase [Gammaproteobacteria bacterium]